MPPSPSLGCFQFWRREVFLWATNQIRLGHVFGDPGQLRENHLPMFTTDMISKSAERENHVRVFTRDMISKIEGVLSLVKKQAKARK